jgi:hypothetical protein
VDEGLETVEKQNNSKRNNANPCHIWLEPSSEVKILSVDALDFQSTVESDEASADTDPCNQATKSCDLNIVREYRNRAELSTAYLTNLTTR